MARPGEARATSVYSFIRNRESGDIRLSPQGMKPFAADIRCLSAGVNGLDELEQHWNRRFGRFTTLAFGAEAEAPAR